MAAIGDRLRTARPSSRPGSVRMIRRAWYAFTSVRVANVLLLAMLIAALPGLLVKQFGTTTLADPALLAAAIEGLPSRYGQSLAGVIERLDLYRVFTSWWWTLLVALFTVSVVGNTASRFPRLLRDVQTPPVKRGRAFFRSSVPGRTGPLEGLDGSALPELLAKQGYRVRLGRTADTTHLVAERNRLAPLASVASHASLVLFVIGMGFVTPRFGYETALKVPVGEGRPTGFPDDPQTVLVQNDDFVARFDPAGAPLDYRTTLTVYRNGGQVAHKEITVNDPLSVDGWTFHENFFGPAVEIDVRDKSGLILYSGAVLLDGNLAGKPEGLLPVPGTDVSLELILAKGEGGVAELTVIGARQPTADQEGPQIVFGAVLNTGDGYWAPDPGVGVEFRKPSSYIGLIAKRDPGQGFIWLGALLLVGGLSVSLLRPRRRIWARYDATTVRLAVVGGDPFLDDAAMAIVSVLPPVVSEPGNGRGSTSVQGPTHV